MRRNRERPRWRKPGGMRSRSASMAPEASEALERFLADIRDTPVLSAEATESGISCHPSIVNTLKTE